MQISILPFPIQKRTFRKLFPAGNVGACIYVYGGAKRNVERRRGSVVLPARFMRQIFARRGLLFNGLVGSRDSLFFATPSNHPIGGEVSLQFPWNRPISSSRRGPAVRWFTTALFLDLGDHEEAGFEEVWDWSWTGTGVQERWRVGGGSTFDLCLVWINGVDRLCKFIAVVIGEWYDRWDWNRIEENWTTLIYVVVISIDLRLYCNKSVRRICYEFASFSSMTLPELKLTMKMGNESV